MPVSYGRSDKAPAWLQDAPDLFNCSFSIADMVEHVACQNQVEGALWKWDGLGVDYLEGEGLWEFG